MTTQTVIIVNPAAGRGKASQLLPQIRESFGAIQITDLRHTGRAGDEDSLANEAISRNATTIVAVGGDGTCSRIANQILKSGKHCRLAVVPTGTGNDFAKTLGVAAFSPEQIAALVAKNDASWMDVGLANAHYFVNSCGFGFDASVLEASQRVRFLKGDAVYIYSALKKLFTYRGVAVSTPSAPGGRMLMVTVSNGRHLGGAFLIAPRASVVDGQLDIALFADCNVVERARIFAGALRGTHLSHPAVRSSMIRSTELSFDSKPAMEIDGELRHATSRTIEITCVPRALSVIAAPGAVV